MQQLFQCCGWNNDSDFGAGGPPLSCLNPSLDPPVNFENGCKVKKNRNLKVLLKSVLRKNDF